MDRRGRRRLISWLSWGLGLDQVWQTATALKQGIGMLPALVTELADHFLPTCRTTSSRTTRASSTTPSARS